MRTRLTNDGTIGKVIGWREWYDNESAYLVCGAAGSSPSLNQQSKDKGKLMIDSGSQSTA